MSEDYFKLSEYLRKELVKAQDELARMRHLKTSKTPVYEDLLATLLTLDDDIRNRLVKDLNAYLTVREKCAMMKDVRWNDHDGSKYYWEDDK